MQPLLALSRLIDGLNTFVGRTVGWLILVAVAVSAGNALMRKIFSQSSNAWLELQWYLFGAVFLLCAGYALLKDAHVRIDVLSSRLSKRKRNWIDVLGHVFFLAPLCLIILYEGIPFFIRSYLSGENSGNAGGLILWPAKLLVPLGFALLLLQGVSELIKRVAIMRGDLDEPNTAEADDTPSAPQSGAA